MLVPRSDGDFTRNPHLVFSSSPGLDPAYGACPAYVVYPVAREDCSIAKLFRGGACCDKLTIY